MAKKTFIVTALDIGTAFIRAAIAKCTPDLGIEIIGAAVKPCDGVKKSYIVNPEATINIARAAIETAEREANVEVDSVYAGISGGHIKSGISFAISNNLDNDSVIKDKHLNQLIENARVNAAEKGREILHEIAMEYRLDGHAAEKIQPGAVGSRIESKFLVISADKSILENHGRVINSAGFKVDGVCWNVIADGLAVLSEDEKKEGVLLIDIGAGSTGYAVYFNNSIYYANVFAVGGDHIINDLMIGLEVTAADAYDILEGYLKKGTITNNDTQNIIQIGSTAQKKLALNKLDIEMIIESRIEELVQFVINDVRGNKSFNFCGKGIVLVGGTAKIPYLKEKIESISNKQTRVAFPQLSSYSIDDGKVNIFSEKHEYLIDPSCSVLLGLLRSGYNLKLKEIMNNKSFFSKIFNH